MKVALTRADMNRMYPAQVAVMRRMNLPNGAHRFALDTDTDTLSFVSFGDGKSYEWKHGADRWTEVPDV